MDLKEQQKHAREQRQQQVKDIKSLLATLGLEVRMADVAMKGISNGTLTAFTDAIKRIVTYTQQLTNVAEGINGNDQLTLDLDEEDAHGEAS